MIDLDLTPNTYRFEVHFSTDATDGPTLLVYATEVSNAMEHAAKLMRRPQSDIETVRRIA